MAIFNQSFLKIREKTLVWYSSASFLWDDFDKSANGLATCKLILSFEVFCLQIFSIAMWFQNVSSKFYRFGSSLWIDLKLFTLLLTWNKSNYCNWLMAFSRRVRYWQQRAVKFRYRLHLWMTSFKWHIFVHFHSHF